MKIGILYIVATPIGNLSDLSQRAIETLNQVDLIAVEDTRHSGRLLKHFDIETPMLSHHEHNEHTRYQKIIDELKSGKNIALISDAGTPLISDPGFQLVREARAQEIEVIPIPGACAAITALCIAGLPTDRFIFEGFLPARQVARIQQLECLKQEARTLVFYETPHRILDCLKDIGKIFGEGRHVVVTRELTKIHESVYEGTVDDVLTYLTQHKDEQCGEFVVLVKGSEAVQTSDQETQRVLEILLSELSVKQAAQLASKITGHKKNELYDLALQLKK